MTAHENPSKQPDGAVATTYLREMLELNPMWQAPQIMRRRHELWRGYDAPALVPNTAAPKDTNAEQRLRNRAQQCLDALQSNFYQLPDEKLRQYIGALESDRLPEYNATAVRLRAVANVRGELLEALRETNDEKFAYSLQQTLVSPPIESGTLREQYIESLISERRVAKGCATVRRYVSAHPQIYELERDWFDTLLDRTNQREWKSRYSYGARSRSFFEANAGKFLTGAAAAVIMVCIGVYKIPRGMEPTRDSLPKETGPRFTVSGQDSSYLPSNQDLPGNQYVPTNPPARSPGASVIDPLKLPNSAQREAAEFTRRLEQGINQSTSGLERFRRRQNESRQKQAEARQKQADEMQQHIEEIRKRLHSRTPSRIPEMMERQTMPEIHVPQFRPPSMQRRMTVPAPSPAPRSGVGGFQ